jgi:hypothetical protein
MKVPKRPARKRSRGAARPVRREDQAKTADLLPTVDWVASQQSKPKKPRRGR